MWDILIHLGDAGFYLEGDGSLRSTLSRQRAWCSLHLTLLSVISKDREEVALGEQREGYCTSPGDP
jgi:hypothetical protein